MFEMVFGDVSSDLACLHFDVIFFVLIQVQWLKSTRTELCMVMCPNTCLYDIREPMAGPQVDIPRFMVHRVKIHNHLVILPESSVSGIYLTGPPVSC